MKAITELLTPVIEDIRKELGNHNIGNFHLEIRSEGRTETGGFLLTYRLSECNYTPHVEGNDLSYVVTEFVRRNGWQKLNEPIMITSEEHFNENISDEVPF